MVPCSRLYGFLGVSLAAAHPSRRGNPYADWINMYSGFDYLVCAVVGGMGGLLVLAGEEGLGPEDEGP